MPPFFIGWEMRPAILFLLLIRVFAYANLDQVFSEGDDPAIFHHVNVITGNLNLSFQDALIQGAKPIPIHRSYTSSGALERTPENTDLIFKYLRKGWMVQGGWSLFPHENMLIETPLNRKEYKVYLSEPSGSMITYAYSHNKKEGSPKHVMLRV